MTWHPICGLAEDRMEKMALVGGGLTGQAWAVVFVRAGHEVVMYDASPMVIDGAEAAIAGRLDELARFGLIEEVEPVLARIGYVFSVADAVSCADYVQESVAERV